MTVLVLGPITVSHVLSYVALVLGVVAVAFLLGALNPATMLGRLLGRDVAASGSGNPGATNAGRVLGVKWGVLVGVLDVAKGFVPVWAVGSSLGEVAALVGLAVVAGHMFSPFLRGRGGKGVATALGAMLAFTPWFGLLALIVFAVSVAIVRITGVGSIVTCVVLLVSGLVVGLVPGLRSWSLDHHLHGLWVALLAAMVLWRHRSNIRGLRRAISR